MNELWPNRAMIKPKEVAQQADICMRLMYELLNTGKLKSQRIGRSFRIPRAEALRFLGLTPPEEVAAPALAVVRDGPAIPSDLSPHEQAMVRRALRR